jgi:hypothetical protein
MYKKSIVSTVLFGFLFFFFIIYFIVVGQESFMTKRIHNIITSSLILIVFSSYYVFLKMSSKKEQIVDERDLLIQKQATSIGMTITAMLIFITAITLFVLNEDRGVIDVSWMWLFAFGNFVFTYFITSLSILLIYKNNE